MSLFHVSRLSGGRVHCRRIFVIWNFLDWGSVLKAKWTWKGPGIAMYDFIFFRCLSEEIEGERDFLQPGEVR